MRELVYLSQRKLRQFDLGKPLVGLRGLRGRIGGEVKVPGLGGLTLDKGAERTPELDEVIAAVDEPAGQSAEIAVERVAYKLPWYAEVIDVVSRELELPVTAAGWARVTAAAPAVDGRRIVMATPLYVEHVSEPS